MTRCAATLVAVGLLACAGGTLPLSALERLEAPAPFHAEPVAVTRAPGDCGPDECVGRGQVWAPMWDLRGSEHLWEIRASGAGAVAVGSWFDSDRWRVEVHDAAGALVGVLDPERGKETYELQFCSEPGALYSVRVLQPGPAQEGLHYRMYWRGIDWARTAAPMVSDAETGFDQRWGDLPARFAETFWLVEVEEGARELVVSYEHVVGEGNDTIRLFPPGSEVPALERPGMPGSGTDHWPARQPGCRGDAPTRIPPPLPTRECTYYDILEPIADPVPGFWRLRLGPRCDGDPDTPEPFCDPFAAHYVLNRHDGGPGWFYLDEASFLNPDIHAAARAQGSCRRYELDGSGSWSNSGGLTWSWYDQDGTLLATGEQAVISLETACREVTLEVTDRCGLRDRTTLAFEDAEPPRITCPPEETLPVDRDCRGRQVRRASAEDDCDTVAVSQDPPALHMVRLDPGECRRRVGLDARARDDCDNEASCAWSLTFEDRTPPRITCPRDGDATPDLFEVVADDRCRGVFDEPAEAADNCDEPEVISDPPLPLPLTRDDLDDPRRVEYGTSDACGQEASCAVRTVLLDRTPPVIEEIAFDGGCLWPPNHKLVCLEIGEWVRWSDNCSEPGLDDGSGIRVVSCSSDQEDQAHGQGDGRSSEDCRILEEGARLCVRSERQGRDREDGFDGRAYRVEIEVVDGSGNTTTATGRLRVPHDRHRGQGSCTRDIRP